mmetsp:Transcript_22061/g.51895  ORF Transcript_22061/g.51895 Transcript_22061/m.51895 type:complete len:603 (+) Transcript_22061:117-1925(+)|eukprot:CAMPEP_0113445970 /NCGR_PEP_ID=MMETSP0014_2-20120614/3461_1 /TAXON_ID=2857 /ORGANISM="Nitzschia sp." /LENGTH=602 /DNA_ID=CAMNT_0000337039 /DNA_START=32 /DNA_END=1840 /DNA_ORIENTATION=- /assembly_acc=CAM_ASM_000159
MEDESTATSPMEWTKELFEEKAGCSITSEFWTDHEADVQESNGKGKMWNLIVKFANNNADKDAALAGLRQQLANSSTSAIETKQYLVLSASATAKDTKERKNFRDKQVAEKPCRGGFIATKFYLNFVLAAREVNGSLKNRDAIIKKVAALGEILNKRKDHSLFGTSCIDAEAPQSAIASELFRLAICLVSSEESTSPNGLKVTHQQQLVTEIKSEMGLEVISTTPKKRKINCNSTKKAQDEIDVCIWFSNPENSLGACVVAACEYKPSNTNADEREAQADMYGSNIIVLHQKQCIVVDIAGSNDVKAWKVSAHGLIKNEFSESPAWEKTPLYKGTGAEAIVLVSHGLVNAKKFFPKALKQYGGRLGPSVGNIDGYVYKVYDNAKMRQPNIEVVKDLFDENAELLKSKDGDLRIIKMRMGESNWKAPVSSNVFKQIIEKLQKLHEKYGPHGDIRLANLLSTGDIIDFDFVGLETYPSTLQLISQDGERHGDVKQMIEFVEKGFDTSLEPATEHDWYSLGKVMSLFVPTDQSNCKAWDSFCRSVETGSLIDSGIGDFEIKLGDLSIPIKGTENTPEKKQPVQNDTSTNYSKEINLPPSITETAE